jgi:thiol:disulfide interchange protein
MASSPHLAQTSSAIATPREAAGIPSGYVHAFDPNRDAVADIRAAIAEARRTQKRVLLYIGGSWCMYCYQMDQLFQKNPDLLQLRDSNFITVDVYYGAGENNVRALSPYTKVLGVPHFFVLESDGNLLHSQHVLELRAGGAYSPAKFQEFFQRWARPQDLQAVK